MPEYPLVRNNPPKMPTGIRLSAGTGLAVRQKPKTFYVRDFARAGGLARAGLGRWGWSLGLVAGAGGLSH